MKLRIRFSKRGKVRFTGHRDVARIWERTLRKAQVPIALTEGFSPRPKLSFGLALPTGAESDAEYLDVVVAKGIDVTLEGLAGRLADALPPGFEVMRVEECLPGTPSLQESVVASGWEITFRGVDAADVHAAAERLLQADKVMLTRERKGERSDDDVRPAIESLSVDDTNEHGVCLRSVLATTGRGIRPQELAAVMLPGLDPLDVVAGVLRTHQWTERDGERHELLPVAAPVSAR